MINPPIPKVATINSAQINFQFQNRFVLRRAGCAAEAG